MVLFFVYMRAIVDVGADNQIVKTESESSLADARVSLVKEDREVISQFVRSLFSLLYEVCSCTCCQKPEN